MREPVAETGLLVGMDVVEQSHFGCAKSDGHASGRVHSLGIGKTSLEWELSGLARRII